MRKIRILPKLAITGVIKNGTVYFPYMGAGVFSVFVYFVFASILHNDIVNTLPKSGYAMIMLMIGQVLLSLIMLPFLFYTNSFLIKRRKREIGLYSVLGLEKKHVGFMLLVETLLVYASALAGGILCGMVFAKLVFLLLLNMAGLPVDAEFTWSGAAFCETAGFFGAVYALNLGYNLWEMSRTGPVELLSGARRGEKEPKHLLLPSLIGAVSLGAGYRIAVTAGMDSKIFENFFLAVLLVVIGTYFLFTTGSILFLRAMKKRKRFYYKPTHFITVSGMLYRMKKNAASLVNICIFATMVMITLSCTLALFRGTDGILQFDYPYDVRMSFSMDGAPGQLAETLSGLQEQTGVRVKEMTELPHYLLSYEKRGEALMCAEGGMGGQSCGVGWLTLETYNRAMGARETLREDEALVYSTGPDWEEETVALPFAVLTVKARPQQLKGLSKAQENEYGNDYYIVVANEDVLKRRVEEWKEMLGVTSVLGSFDVYLMLEGEETAGERFVEELQGLAAQAGELRVFTDGFERREELASMNGGLLFIGIIFGVTFLLCMILIMYYKQISEGYEDRENFAIMRQVGMSDGEIKRTIGTQVLFVFSLPFAGALCHMLAGMPLVKELFGAICFFDGALIMQSAWIVTALMALCYGVSYRLTAGAYYRIVRQ